MEGIINNFRRSRAHQNTKHIIISLPGVDSKEKAKKHVGKKVTFTTPSGKDITGEIRASHGNSGAARAIFERSLPGQSLGKKVKVA
ncbi:50S ribosomal protein L35ae [Candidatus Woesearchaeota archaeon]|nr:50S ribosomal protein L35ae [Candidatus Woesearchaeota archaeon]